MEWTREIYVLRDAAGDVLYVGCTIYLKVRLQTLPSQVPWWSEVADIRSYRVPEMRAGIEELAAIRALRPRYNRAGLTAAYCPPPGLGRTSIKSLKQRKAKAS